MEKKISFHPAIKISLVVGGGGGGGDGWVLSVVVRNQEI